MSADWLLLVEVALRPVWTLGLIALAGFLFFRWTNQGTYTLDVLSLLVISVLVPCLIVSQLCRETSLAPFVGWYWLPIGAVVLTAVGFGLGLLVSVSFLSSREWRMRLLFANMVAFQNAGYMPLPIIACLFPGDDRMLAMVMLFVAGVTPLSWTISPAVLAGGVGGRLGGQQALTPPLVAIFCSFLLVVSGITAWLRSIPVGKTDLLTFLLAPFALAAHAAVPTILVVLGGTVARLLHDVPLHSRDRSRAALRWFPLLLVAVRLVTMPLLGFLVLPRLGLPPAVTVILLVETLTPTALTLSVQSRVYGNEEMAAMVGRGLLYSYLACGLTVPFWLALFKMAVEPALR